jgi:hypothetical protein
MEAAMSEFSTKDIQERIGIKPRMIKFYVEHGVVTPEIAEAAGTGKHRRYSLKNLLEFALVHELAQYGITVAALGGMVGGSLLKSHQYTDKEWLETMRPVFKVFIHPKGGFVTVVGWPAGPYGGKKRENHRDYNYDVLLHRFDFEESAFIKKRCQSMIVIDAYNLFKNLI